jgi:hypothetical protein
MSYHKIEKSRPSPNASHETHLPAPVVKVPTLKHGNDAKRAKELNKLIKDAESGLCRILKVGFFLECLADDLPHGQLGPWVEAHCNRNWRTVQRWKQVAAGVGDALGISLKQRLEYRLHEVLALPLKKVPADLKSVREKIDAEIAGKSYRQLFLELKQVREDDPTKPKAGRRKGEGGATKEQRANAEELERQERITERKLRAEETANWLIEMSDDAGFGEIAGTHELDVLVRAMEQARGYIKNHGGAK